MHTVKRAAELTGIPAATLRMWERRYGVVTPSRTDGGYRLYDDRAMRRLAAMKALVDTGWSPAQAARQVADEEPGGAAEPNAPRGTAQADLSLLPRIAADFDAAALDDALDEAFARADFEEVVDGWLMPSLAALGSAWRQGELTIAGEHFVSATVQRRLAAFFDAAGSSASGPPVVVGLARGSRHELGVLAFATALRRAGVATVYVGGDLPPQEWVATVRARGAAAVVLGVPAPEDVPAVRETADALRAAVPDLPVYVGGGQQAGVGGAVLELGHRVGAAAQRLAAALEVAS